MMLGRNSGTKGLSTRQLAMRCLFLGVAPAARDAWQARRPRFSRSLVYCEILLGCSSAYGAAPVGGRKAGVPTEVGTGVSLGSGHQGCCGQREGDLPRNI